MSLSQRMRTFAARRSPLAFAGLLGRDEATGAPIKLAGIHRSYQHMLDHPKAIVLAPPETGKSAQASLRLAWEAGRNPALCCAIVSGTREQAARHLVTVGNITRDPLFQRVFPGVRIERQTQDGIWLKGRSNPRKDPNIIAAAFDLSSLLGTRLDLVVADDIVSREATRTHAARERAYQDFVGIIGGRLSPSGRIWVLNTAEHSDDVPHRLSRLPGWEFQTFPLLDKQGDSRWPERWSTERIESRRLELGPAAFRRLMLCQPIDEATQVFHEELVTRALKQGVAGLGQFTPIGGRTIVAVDPAWSTSASADESAIVVVTLDSEGYRHLVHVEGHRINSDSLVRRVATLAQVNGRAQVYIESNSGGQIIGEQLQKVYPRTTLVHTSASSKAARVEWLAAELGAGRWAFRNMPGESSKELEKLSEDLVSFSFESHTGDRLAALLVAVEGVRKFEARPKGHGWFHFDLTTGISNRKK